MNEERAIFRAQQLDLMYAQSGLLYEIIPNTLWYNFDPKFKHGTHVDGIVGYTSSKGIDQVMNQMGNLSINQSATRQYSDSSNPNKMADVLLVHTSDYKGN